jgi:hypothetical protein
MVALRVSWASFFTSAATTAKERPASPARAASMVALRRQHVGFLGDRLDAGDTLRTLAIASAKPAMRSPSWTTRLVRPWNTRIVSSIAPLPCSSFSRACSASICASSVESATRAWSPSRRLVTCSNASSVFKLAEIRPDTPAT